MMFVFITYNAAIHDEVMEVLSSLDLESYTRWEGVTGAGTRSGPHLNTHIWPARNSALAVVTKEEKAKKLLEEIRRLRKTIGKEGVKAFSWKVDEMT